jgi:hypothetical protein
MAVPPEISTRNLTGVYTLNRILSDSSQTVLKMQNIGWVVRQAVAYSTVTVTLQQYDDSDGKPHLDQEQISTGGIRNFEDRIMDWQDTLKENWIWGKVNGRSRYVGLKEIEDPYLKEGWGQDCVEGEVVEGYVESVKDGWDARQIWGFADVDGQRRHVRKILARRPGWDDQRIRMVYDWYGPANAKT